MNSIRTPIIPIHPTLAKVKGPHELDLKAICSFMAVGFFLDTDTFWKNQKVLAPATDNVLSENGILKSSERWFKWHYSPRDISFEAALEEFTFLFEKITEEQIQNQKVVFPLSGGLDSRTQAVALKYLNKNVFAFSYEFENGYAETKIAERIARACDFNFKSYTVSRGYLWGKIEELASITQCYSDFTSPRQMAITENFKGMGSLFSLGHWGDVLFDNMGLRQMSHEEEVDLLIKKLVKRGGMELASNLWEVWGLKGNFKTYFYERISKLLSKIAIENTNAKLRAFKSTHWATRWTSVNLKVFSNYLPITLPYYDNRMCQYICTIPEEFLQGRKLQIEYIKKRNKRLAKIEWQDHRPFNLYTYPFNKLPYNLPYRALNKCKRSLGGFFGKKYIQRNWELQFYGNENEKYLQNYLFNNGLDTIVPKDMVIKTHKAFKGKESLDYAHQINMLLVLSMFNKLQTK